MKYEIFKSSEVKQVLFKLSSHGSITDEIDQYDVHNNSNNSLPWWPCSYHSNHLIMMNDAPNM